MTVIYWGGKKAGLNESWVEYGSSHTDKTPTFFSLFFIPAFSSGVFFSPLLHRNQDFVYIDLIVKYILNIGKYSLSL